MGGGTCRGFSTNKEEVHTRDKVHTNKEVYTRGKVQHKGECTRETHRRKDVYMKAPEGQTVMARDPMSDVNHSEIFKYREFGGKWKFR